MKMLTLLLCIIGVAVGAPTPPKLDLLKFVHEANSVVVYSLFPSDIVVEDLHGNRIERSRDSEHFHGFPVLGKADALGRDELDAVRLALLATLKPVMGDRAPYMCFTPRHGVCMTKGDQHVDLVLCFECEEARIVIYSENRREKLEMAIGSDALDTLNAILDRRRISRDIPKTKKPNKSPLRTLTIGPFSLTIAQYNHRPRSG